MAESEDKPDDQQEPLNWLGDLVKRETVKGRHWLEGLIKPARKAEKKKLDLPPELKALLDEEPEPPTPPKSPPEVEPVEEEEFESISSEGEHEDQDSFEEDDELGRPEEKTVALPEGYFDPPPEPEPEPPPKPIERLPKRSQPKPSRQDKPEPKPKYRFKIRVDAKAVKERLIMYRALAIMLESGVSIFAAFQFLSEQATTEQMRESCSRVAQQLATGHSLALVASTEPTLFSNTSARMLEVGMRSGKLVAVLQRLAEDEQQRWEMRQRLWGQLLYPVTIAGLALCAAILLPPLVLSGVLEEVVALTDDPPAITTWLLWFSSTMSSSWTIGAVLILSVALIYFLTRPVVRETLRTKEYILWHIPGLGDVPRTVYSCRFLQLFSLAYDVGLPVTQSLKLASEATGSYVMHEAGIVMDREIKAGSSLVESIEAANFLPVVALEAVNAGEQVGKVSVMIKKVADILLAELDSRIDNALKLIEPAFLLVLGTFVGVFALGCLLPILKLAETL